MTSDTETNLEDDDSGGTAVCPKCLNELPPTVDFCPNCRAPVTPFANTGFLEGAQSKGWGLGEVVSTKRPSLVTLIGLWLIMSPIVLLAPLFVFLPRGYRQDLGDAVMNGMAGLMFCFALWCLYRVTSNYFRGRGSTDVTPLDESEEHPAESE